MVFKLALNKKAVIIENTFMEISLLFVKIRLFFVKIRKFDPYLYIFRNPSMYCTRGKLAMDYLTENLNLILISLLIVFAHVAAHDWGINTMWSGLEEYQN